MKKKFIIEIDCCENCDFCHNMQTNKKKESYYFCVKYPHKIENIKEISKDCKLTELKPKELEWEKSNKSTDIIEYKSKSYYPFEYEYSIWHDSVEIYLNRYKIGSLPMQDNIRKKAEQYCLENYNNLFREMAGGIK